MLAQELTSSLRQDLLWERQQNKTTTGAVAKHQQSALSLPALRRATTISKISDMTVETEGDDIELIMKSRYWDHFSTDYHQTGW
jgi:hypothetical protein